MDRLRCATDSLPPYLWRVQYSSSQTSYCPDSNNNGHHGYGLQARDTHTFYTEDKLESFRQSVERQFTWSWRGPQPYISLFSDEEHAENWALREPWKGNYDYHDDTSDWEILTINTRQLQLADIYIFKLSDLQRELDVSLPERAQQHSEGAYLCLHRIPASAIVQRRAAWQIKQGMWSDAIVFHADVIRLIGDFV